MKIEKNSYFQSSQGFCVLLKSFLDVAIVCENVKFLMVFLDPIEALLGQYM